jgi:hypothetical protein
MKTTRLMPLSLLIGLVATTLLAGTAHAAAPHYVALGDSAASGPLIPLPDLSAPGCYRSTNNYPKLAAARLGVPITDVTCSGADTADMTNSQNTDFGAVPQAVNLFRALGDLHSEATVLAHLGDTQQAASNTRAAWRSWHSAIGIYEHLDPGAANRLNHKLESARRGWRTSHSDMS